MKLYIEPGADTSFDISGALKGLPVVIITEMHGADVILADTAVTKEAALKAGKKVIFLSNKEPPIAQQSGRSPQGMKTRSVERGVSWVQYQGGTQIKNDIGRILGITTGRPAGHLTAGMAQ